MSSYASCFVTIVNGVLLSIVVWKCLFILMCFVYVDHTRCNAWVLDGDLYHKGLQGVAVPVDSIGNSLLLITVDMARPWNALDSLQKWAAVAREHIDKLRVPPETLRELEHKRESYWRQSGRRLVKYKTKCTAVPCFWVKIRNSGPQISKGFVLGSLITRMITLHVLKCKPPARF